MLKKLRYVFKNYDRLKYLVDNFDELQYLVDYSHELRAAYEDRLSKLEEKVNNTKERKKFSIAGVPKGQKEYVVGLLKQDGESVLEEKMRKRGDQ